MDWQLWTVLVLVGAASLYLARATWRTWSGAKGKCGGSCGCGQAAAPREDRRDEATLIRVDQLTLRQPSSHPR